MLRKLFKGETILEDENDVLTFSDTLNEINEKDMTLTHFVNNVVPTDHLKHENLKSDLERGIEFF